MTNKQEKKTVMAHNDMTDVSKHWVNQTRTWATSMREAFLTPWEGIYREHEVTNMMFGPWINMTRAAHDRWLDMFETQTTEMIERSTTIMKQIQQ